MSSLCGPCYYLGDTNCVGCILRIFFESEETFPDLRKLCNKYEKDNVYEILNCHFMSGHIAGGRAWIRTQLADIEKIRQMDNQIEQVNDRVHVINEDMDALRAGVDMANEDVVAMRGEVNQMRDDVNLMRDDVNLMRGQVDILHGDVAWLDQSVAGVTHWMEDIQLNLDGGWGNGGAPVAGPEDDEDVADGAVGGDDGDDGANSDDSSVEE